MSATVSPTPTAPRGFVPFHRPSIEEEDVRAVVDALRSGWLTHGPICRRFESEFASAVGAGRAVCVSSGTAAMHLALVALGVEPGDEVVTTPFTFCATAHVIEHAGARPVFVDIEPEFLQIDPEGVRRATTSRTKAILPVHYGGHPCSIEEIVKLADDLSIAVVEDAAHALGAFVGRRPIGSIGTATAFSFYATKNITTGEGGMVTTDDADLADRLESLRLHGITRDAWNRYGDGGSWSYQVLEPGFKANLTDFQAALGLSQLAREPKMREARARVAERYEEAFEAVAGLIQLPSVAAGVTPAWHLYPIRLRLEALAIDRDRFIEELESRGVGASVHFVPLHLQPHFRERFGFGHGDFPHAEAAFRRVISLPIYPSMGEDEIEHVIDSVMQVARAHAR